MALIIEDGSIVANANSYVTVAEFRSHLTTYGTDDSAYTDAQIEVFLIKAMDKIAEYRSRFLGERTSSDQVLDWPRRGVVGVYLPGEIMATDHIPDALKTAQKQFATSAIDNDLQPDRLPTDPAPAIKKKVGPVEVVYESDSKRQPLTPYFAKAEIHIQELCRNQGFHLVRT